MNVDVLDRDLLLALPAVAIERVEQHREGAGKLASLAQIIPEESRASYWRPRRT
jgi:hypothetical protein